MKPEDQNIAIATKLGWKIHNGMWHNPDGTPIGFIPDYTRDLNAMHEAEKIVLLPEYAGGLKYSQSLRQITENEKNYERWQWNATAAQRCEAFLKTLNLWKETEA